MERIESFKVDHEKLFCGLYKSRTDENSVTLDLRIRTPYHDELLTNAQMHSLEHLLATVLRNSPHSNSVIYVGPMGCQTGFYCVFDKSLSEVEMTALIVEAFKTIAFNDMNMPGNSKKECGNHLNLSIDAAKIVAREYYNLIKDKTVFDLYP